MKYFCLTAVTGSLLALAGCAMGPNYHRPDNLPAPDAYRDATNAPGNYTTNAANATNAAIATNSFADLPWWEVFKDSTLQDLVRTAVTNNYDLQIAVSRVEQARQVVVEARSGLFPQLGYSGAVGRGKNVGAGNTLSPTGITGTVFEGDVTASWDIDIWGRIRRLTESARAQYLATQQARRDVMAGLVTELAQDYFQLLELDREMQIARDTTNSFGDSLKIFSKRLQGGVSSKLETASAEALLDSAAATIPQIEERIILQENQIRILLGQAPGAIPRGTAMLDDQVGPEIPAGIPSSLLERRPDIREAEQQLVSANAQVGVAKANFFPQLSLSALFGRVSPELSGLTGGGANAWSLAASLTGPIFEGGLLTAQYRQALAARKQAVIQYQAAVLYALQQVSGALVSHEKLGTVRYQQARAVDAYKEAVRIAMERYRLGESSYYEVLQEQQLLFPAENALVQTQLDQLDAVVQLYRALGGGWKTKDDPDPDPK